MKMRRLERRIFLVEPRSPGALACSARLTGWALQERRESRSQEIMAPTLLAIRHCVLRDWRRSYSSGCFGLWSVRSGE
ncbi:hypothetical protein DT603_09215 [Pseudoxanthomonas gei]|uniref:Uncharacterized protein n=1 Tax=Pseudoxanthomonas gei TaxID=1383030 RepID=A0ABX0ADR0_9GAMM|nr:hypothetical protein [Pseudoxanthomonas gei]NDK39018.1 hypothetical protein [Pseudoxanthomonas gei]